MTWKLDVDVRALADLEEIRDYYESARAGLGDEFIDAMESMFEKLTWNPQMYAAGFRGVRATKHPRFPHVIRDRIRKDIVEVFAVMHGSRRTSAWMSRLP